MRTAIALAAAVLVVCILENLAFGEDRPGTAHDISVAFFFVSVLSAATLLGLLAVALTQRVRHRRGR
ncbi:MAG: hypothetical protein M3071_14240 [Actinomycetota bacterium]|nr:hypothetical protein [Actinomycetota bacterium]